MLKNENKNNLNTIKLDKEYQIKLEIARVLKDKLKKRVANEIPLSNVRFDRFMTAKSYVEDHELSVDSLKKILSWIERGDQFKWNIVPKQFIVGGSLRLCWELELSFSLTEPSSVAYSLDYYFDVSVNDLRHGDWNTLTSYLSEGVLLPIIGGYTQFEQLEILYRKMFEGLVSNRFTHTGNIVGDDMDPSSKIKYIVNIINEVRKDHNGLSWSFYGEK